MADSPALSASGPVPDLAAYHYRISVRDRPLSGIQRATGALRTGASEKAWDLRPIQG